MSASQKSRFADALDELEAGGLRRRLPVVGERDGPRVAFGDSTLLNLSSNDYLGLGNDPSLQRSFFGETGAMDPALHGMTASASRLLSGNHPAYALLEQDISALYGERAATVFSSGYHANVGICSALADRHSLFLADKLCHASLIDGMRLSGAQLLRYRHRDLDHLEDLLEKHAGKDREVFIVTESVFSMDGDTADLERHVRLKQRYGAMLIVDEAHAAGVFGDRGLGLCERDGLAAQVDVLVGTFGKALASFGAFAITDSIVRDYLVNRARPLIFTTALPPAVVNWTRITLAHSVSMRRERQHLAVLASGFRNALREGGVETGGNSQIVPAVVGGNRTAGRVAEALREAGFLAFPIRPPTVPEGTARIRFSLTADMRWEDISPVPAIVSEHLHDEKNLDTTRS
jgi:8-amino-7-oxononanoate synthase